MSLCGYIKEKASEMAQQVKVSGTKPEALSSIQDSQGEKREPTLP